MPSVPGLTIGPSPAQNGIALLLGKPVVLSASEKPICSLPEYWTFWARGGSPVIIRAIVAATKQIPYGDPRDPANTMGPVIRKSQHERILGIIEGGKAQARLACGGGVPDGFDRGYFIEPTVFADVPNESALAQDEIFGPVVCVTPYEDDDDAVRIANDSRFGLSGAVTGRDTERAWSIARRVRTGTMSINGGAWFAVDAPFGGYRESGLGRENGRMGLEEYLETKLIASPV